MSHEKMAGPIPTEVLESNNEAQTHIMEKGTERDRRDMLRMGKTQELRRNFGYFSIFGLAMVLMATWEAQLVLKAVLGWDCES
jgi:choline transport protein